MHNRRIEVYKASSPNTTRPILKAFFNIMDAWGLSNDQQMKILAVPRATFFKWKKYLDGNLSRDTLERISYIFGIYKDLQILLPAPDAADKWIKKPNDAPIFGGKSALDRILSGHVADLYIVRQYLDSERGGWT